VDLIRGDPAQPVPKLSLFGRGEVAATHRRGAATGGTRRKRR
jgi:hypothetical protein